MKATTIRFRKGQISPKLAKYLVDDEIKVMMTSREEVEAAGLTSIIAFADRENKAIIFIEDDCEALSPQSLECILAHEYAHLRYAYASEMAADQFAIRMVGYEAYQLAEAETRVVILRLRQARGIIASNDNPQYAHRTRWAGGA